ncbi:MAG: methionine-R-sulfoxide reductase [Acidobacteriota bacterium]|jgi:peptide-methionine (R)-S-oxide reductase
MTSRRLFMLAPALLAGCARPASPVPQVEIADFDASGKALGAHPRPKVIRSTAEWRQLLTLNQFYSTRQSATDTPFAGTYYRLHDAGLYRCTCCETALFHSGAKFDSSTGWPAFTQPVDPRNIRTRADHRLPQEERTEVLCALCDAHLGHVFDDGPPPTGLRYCINESGLRFEPA